MIRELIRTSLEIQKSRKKIHAHFFLSDPGAVPGYGRDMVARKPK